MARNYLDILAETIRNNWDQPALTDFYLTEDGTAQDTSRGNHYTYGEMYAEIVSVSDLLTHLGLQKSDHIVICGVNSAHWVIAYLAIAKMQGVSVTVMHSLQPDEIAQLIDFSDATTLFVDNDLWKELKEKSLPQVQSVISLEAWQILKGEKFEIPNRKSLIDNRECGFLHPGPDNLAMICFTSGTTERPKGVMLPYRNISNLICGFERFMVYEKYQSQNMLALLPMAHIYGLLIETLLPLCSGCNTYIPHFVLSEDILSATEIIRPKIMFMVPAVLPHILKDIHKAKAIIQKMDFLVVAGASMSKEMLDLIVTNKIPIATGYGLTECCCCCWQWPDYFKIGALGKVVPGIEVRFAPSGEILVKGENVMLGYYKDPVSTAAKIDKDGWLHTGDKGHLDEDGYLYVEGRLEQDIIVLPNGENIRPDNIESLINAMPEVKESIVLARDGRLIAIVVPEITNHQLPITHADLRRSILRTVNPQLPLFSELYDVEITDIPLQRTEKQTIKRYLYS